MGFAWTESTYSRSPLDFSENSPTNYLAPAAVTDEDLKDELYVGMRFFMPPIIAVGSASDPIYETLRRPEVVGAHHMMPGDWLPGAKSVLSLFLPFTERVISSNTVDPIQPSWEWLFTRVDGQQHLLATAALVRDALVEDGYQAVVPQMDDRYFMRVSPAQTELPLPTFSSNWSERHVGFITGLGTFGRSTNLISKLGACGRLVSIVTDWETEPDEKDYRGVYDYCSECGACYQACPAGAYSDDGKDIRACSGFLHDNCAQYAPRYGCGKCQSGIPCQTRSLRNPLAPRPTEPSSRSGARRLHPG